MEWSPGNVTEEWPATEWDLSAPESYVLLNHGAGADGKEAFKMGLVELLVRGFVELDKQEGRAAFGRVKSVSYLREKAGPSGARLRGPTRAILDVLHGTRTSVSREGATGVRVEDLARQAVRQWGSLGGYVSKVVLPFMGSEGLYREEKGRVLWIIPSTRWVLTDRGAAAKADLERWMQLGQSRFSEWVDDDPHRALAYAGMAGAAVLLMSPLFPDLQQLRRHLQDAGEGGAGVFVASTGSLGDDRRTPGEMDFDVGFDLGALEGFDFGALDSLSDAVSAIDSGVDSGGGNGGGDDGGGGDGGGGD